MRKRNFTEIKEREQNGQGTTKVWVIETHSMKKLRFLEKVVIEETCNCVSAYGLNCTMFRETRRSVPSWQTYKLCQHKPQLHQLFSHSAART